MEEHVLMRLSQIVNSRWWQSKPTWWWEQTFAAVYIGVIMVAAIYATASDTAAFWGNILGGLAVLYTFKHMSVAARLSEAQERTNLSGPERVDCYVKLEAFLVIKETLWCFSFLLLGAWTALAGVPLFLLYPWWRSMYRFARMERL